MTASEHTQGDRAQGDRAQGEPEPDLTESLHLLTDRIEALQADVRRLARPGLPGADPGWPVEEPAAAPGSSPASYAWLSALEVPVRRRPRAPRLLLETLFLVAVAVAAGVADLDGLVIVAVLAGAWVLVALIEWAASHADRRRNEIPLLAAPVPPEPVPADAAWFVPPVEHTLLEAPADSPTTVTKLPPQQDLDVTTERSPEA